MESVNADTKPAEGAPGPSLPSPNAGSAEEWREESAVNEEDNEEDEMIADNDVFCFRCKKRGEIFCCDNCQRSYHEACLPSKPTEDIWKCPCCCRREQCPICEATVQPLDRFMVCNICYRKTHNSCTHLPKEVLEARLEDGQHPLPEAAFVCYPCLYACEIRLTVRTLRNINYESYRLVNPCFCSGLHLGWISETNLKKIAEKPKKVVKPSKFAVEGFYHPPEVDRIIGMKVPLVYSGKSTPELLAILRDPSRKPDFGCPENFKFLVKWRLEDYASCSWEDEVALRGARWPALQNYLLKKEYEFSCLVEKRAPSQDYRQMPKFLPPLKEREEIFVKELMGMYEARRNVFLMKFTTKEKTYQMLMAALMCRLFYQSLTLEPFLVIARYRDIEGWSRAIGEYCPGMYLVTLTGQQESRDVLKARDLFYEAAPLVPKFDIMLTSCDCFSKDLGKFYNDRLSVSWSSIIYDDELKSNFLIEKDPKARDTHKIWLTKEFDQVEFKLAAKILNPDKRLSTQIKKAELYKEQLFSCIPKSYMQFEDFQVDLTLQRKSLLQYFPKLYNALSRRPDLEPSEFSDSRPPQQPFERSREEDERRGYREVRTVSVAEEIEAHVHTSRFLKGVYESSLNKDLPLEKYKRIAYLRFVIAFGIEFPSSKIFLELLVQFDKGIFVNTEDELERVEAYTMIFLAVLNTTGYHENCARTLFNLKPSAVLRRVIDLHNIRVAYEKYKNDPKAFPIKTRFDIPVELHRENRILPEEAWKAADDLLLLKLILQHGYDNWIEICTSQEWVPQVLQFTLANPLDFLLRKMCNLPTAGPLDQLRSCCRLISSRASLLAELLRHDLS